MRSRVCKAETCKMIPECPDVGWAFTLLDALGMFGPRHLEEYGDGEIRGINNDLNTKLGEKLSETFQISKKAVITMQRRDKSLNDFQIPLPFKVIRLKHPQRTTHARTLCRN